MKKKLTRGALASKGIYPQAKEAVKDYKKLKITKEFVKALNEYAPAKKKKALVGVVLNKKYFGTITYKQFPMGKWWASVKYKSDKLFPATNGKGYKQRKSLEKMLKKRLANYELYDVKILPNKKK